MESQLEAQTMFTPEQIGEIEQLKEEIMKGECVLSYSSFKAFAQSPSHFIRHKIRIKKETPAMKKGKLIHCAVLEPEELEKRYLIMDEKEMPFPDSTMSKKENKAWKESMEAKAKEEGKTIVYPSEWENALRHRDLAYSNQVVASYLNGLRRREWHTTWEFGGFKWHGVIDGLGSNYELDVKSVADASPDKMKWQLYGEKYHWQHFLYRQSPAVAGYFDAFNLLVDGEYGISLLKIQDHQIQKAEAEIRETLEKFKLCAQNDMWEMNYEFWANNPNKGYFTID